MRTYFLETSGYSENELLAWNPHSLLFYTKNGGLYRVTEGVSIEDIKGPPSDPEERID